MANPKSPNASRNITLFLTCIRAEGKFLKFFALVEHNFNELTKLESYLREKAGDLEASVQFQRSYQLPPGSLYCVKSSCKRAWCRARLQNMDVGVDKIAALLIDYGDMEILPVICVRRCDDPGLHGQPLAIECVLADVVPPYGVEWGAEAIKYCEQQLLFQKVSGYVVSDLGKMPVIRIAKFGEGEPFVQRLINRALAKIETIESAAKPEPVYTGPTYKFIPLDVNTSHMVSLVCTISSQDFYVQLSPAEVELKNLMDAIVQWTTCEKTEYLSSSLINTPCLTYVKPHYFRGIIKDVGPDFCKVMLVDYGNIISPGFQALTIIPKHFLSLPAQAVHCTLPDGIQMDVDTLVKLSNKYKYFTCQVLGYFRDRYVVRLFHKNEDITTLQNKVERNVYHSDFISESLQTNSAVEVNTSYVNNLQEFYCQKSEYKNKLDMVTNLLVNAERFTMPDFNKLVPGSAVIAKFSDELWYRARVLKVGDARNVRLFFIDYGNTDNVKLQDLRAVNQELLGIPALAFRFALYDIPASEGAYTDKASEALENLTDDKVLKAEIKCTGADGSYSVVLYDTECPQVSINEKVESILNPPRCVYPPVSKVEVICVVYYTSPSLFFGQLTKYESVALDNLQTEMTAFYNSLPTTKNSQPEVGDLVSAKFSDDNMFYRAKVLSVTGNWCKVFFVDYGNTDNVSMQDIHKLHSKFCIHPIFGIECILENCPASAPMDELEELMLDKDIQVAPVKEISPGKWLVSLIEKYPGNSDILACFERCTNLNKPTTVPKAGFVTNRVNSAPPSKSFVSPSSEVCSHSSQPKLPQSKHSPPPSNEKQTQKRLCDYDAAVVPNTSYKEVYVCLVKDPTHFYCQLNSEDSKLQLLMNKIGKMYDNLPGNELKLTDVRAGLPCCAIYEEDGKWYRARITNYTPGSNSCEVFYVDYGYTEIVPLSKVRELHSEFFDLPLQALQCGLYNIEAHGGTWGARPIEAFTKMVSDKSFLAQFVVRDANGTFLINLLPIPKLTADVLNEEFINLGHAQIKEPNKLLVINSFTASTSFDFAEPNIDMNKQIDVTIVWVTKFMDFFCQLNSQAHKFHKMMDKIQSHNKLKCYEDSTIDRPHPGMICLAQFSDDCAWYRAKILEVERTAVKVYYVDYGNSEIIPKKNVRFTTQDFVTLPAQAIKCRLNDILPSEGGIEQVVTHLFEGESKCMFISKEKGHYLVNLECNGKDVARELVRMGVAISNKPAVSVPKPQSPKSDIAAAAAIPISSELSIPVNTRSFEKGELLNVTLSFVTSPREFWCQLDTTQLNELRESIEDHYRESVASGALSLKVGSPCIARYSCDEGWYRAIVKSCPTDHEVDVFFIDYGNSERVDHADVRDIHPDFLQLPPQTYKCELYGLPPSFDDDSILKFKEIAEEATDLLAEVKNVHNGVLQLTIFETSDDDTQVNVLESVFGASTELVEGEGFLRPEVPLGTQSVYATTVNDPFDFYLQLANKGTDLETFSKEVNDFCCTVTPPILRNVEVGAACFALFSDDNMWYRAIITKIEDDGVTVFFIDYGNSDTVARDDLREVKDFPLRVPPFAIPCQLASISPIGQDWPPTIKETFNELTDTDGVLEATFINQEIPARVTITKDGKSIADSLIEMGLAVPSVEGIGAEAAENLTDMSKSALLASERVLASTNFTTKMAFVVSHDTFFITALDWSEELDALVDAIEDTYGNLADDDDTLRMESLQLKGLCVAKYSDDGAWYRAMITNVEGDNVLVTFIDYGNSEMTPASSLKQLTPNLLAAPPCAVQCRLFNLHPVPERESEITAMLQSLVDEEAEFEVTVMNPKEPYSVQINTKDGDFLTMLIDKGASTSLEVDSLTASSDIDKDAHMPLKVKNGVASSLDVEKGATASLDVDEVATTSSNVDKSAILSLDVDDDATASLDVEDVPEMDNGMAVNVVDELKDVVPTAVTDGKEGYPESVITASSLQVKICFVDTWNKFFVMPINCKEGLDSLMLKIEEEYGCDKDTSELILQTVHVHQPCIAKYLEDDTWYRAVVVAVSDTDIFVNFIDYGNVEICELQNLRAIMPELLVDPPFAIECNLFDVTLAEGADVEVTTRLQTLCDDETIVEMGIFDQAIPCRVRIKSDVDFVEQLMQDDLVIKEPLSGRIQNLDAFKENLQIAFVDNSLEDMKRLTIPVRPLPSDSIAAYAKHCYISNTGSIFLYVVEAHLEDALAELQENLQMCYSDESKADLAIEVGDYCVAKFLDDGCWYRAVVLERHSDRVIVKFVDFGNSEDVNIDCIKELTSTFSEQPNFCIDCVLSCIKAVEGCEESVEVRFLTINEKYQLDICNFNFKDHAVCVRGITLEDESVISQMMEENLVKKVFPSHHAFDTFECMVVNQQVEENMILHLSPLCLEEQYHDIQESLKSAYDGFVLAENVKICINDLYAVKKESEYFRVYVNSCENSIVHVTCVDNGVSYTVPLSDVRLLYPEFCHIPPFSLLCCLRDLRIENQEATSQKLQELLEGRVATCTFTGSVRSRKYHEIVMTVDGKDVLTELLKVQNANSPTIDITNSKTIDVSEAMVPNMDEKNTDKNDLEKKREEEMATKVSADEFIENCDKEISDHLKEKTTISESIDNSDLQKLDDKLHSSFAADISQKVSVGDDLEQNEAEDAFVTSEEVTEQSLLKENFEISKDQRSGNSAVNCEFQLSVSSDFEKCEDERTDNQVVDMEVDDLKTAVGDTLHMLLSDIDDDSTERRVEDRLEAKCVGTELSNTDMDPCEADLPECEQSHFERYQLETPKVFEADVDIVKFLDDKMTVNQPMNLNEICTKSLSNNTVNDLRSDHQNSHQQQQSTRDILATESNLTDISKTIIGNTSVDPILEQNTSNLDKNIADQLQVEETEDFLSSPTMDKENDSQFVYPEDRVLPLGKTEVVVTEVKVQDFSIFLAIRPVSLQEDFEKLQAELNDFYSDVQEEADLSLGPCALQSHDGTWHRGNLLAFEDDYATVLYSDLGQGETTDASHLRKLQGKFIAPAPYIVWCTLQGFNCTDATAVSNHLNADLKNSTVTLEVMDAEHPCQVQISEGNDVIQKLLSDGLLVAESPVLGESGINANLLEKTMFTSENLPELIDTELTNQNLAVNENCVIDRNQNTQAFSSTEKNFNNQKVTYKEN